MTRYVPLRHIDLTDAADEREWDHYRRIGEAEAADADALERQSSSLTLDLASPRALLILDTARTVLTCLQADEDIDGTMTISSVRYEEGGVEFTITVCP